MQDYSKTSANWRRNLIVGKKKVFPFLFLFLSSGQLEFDFKSLGHATLDLFSLLRNFILNQVSRDVTDVIRL